MWVRRGEEGGKKTVRGESLRAAAAASTDPATSPGLNVGIGLSRDWEPFLPLIAIGSPGDS
jgi:hypothetical protein